MKHSDTAANFNAKRRHSPSAMVMPPATVDNATVIKMSVCIMRLFSLVWFVLLFY